MRHNLITFNDLTDEELIRFVQNQDEAAFAELMSRYSPRIWRVILANSRQRRDAEEILMDTWMAVWENIGGLRKVSSFNGWLRQIAYNACNRYYASSHRSRSETPQSRIFTMPETNAAFIEFSPNGKYLASGQEMGAYCLWDLECGEEIHTFHSHKIEHIAFSPCGNVVAGEMEKAFILWDIESSKILLTIPKPEEYAYWWQGGIVFSPCGLYLATGLERVEGMASAPIKLWNTTTGENVATFEGHLVHIHSLAFSPDGTLLASGGYDGTILLWDTKSVSST